MHKCRKKEKNMEKERLKDKFTYLTPFPLATRNDYLWVNTPPELYTSDFVVVIVSSDRNYLNLLEWKSKIREINVSTPKIEQIGGMALKKAWSSAPILLVAVSFFLLDFHALLSWC